MNNYWTEEDKAKLDLATTFEELREVALSVISRMPNPVAMVSGPISSGGEGSISKNIENLNQTVKNLTNQNINIFNQLPFEKPMQRIKESGYYLGEDHLLHGFYLPIFQSGKINKMYFMPNWRTSYGATWEHKISDQLQIPKVYLS